MRLKNRCNHSGHISMFRPWWAKDGESWGSGRHVMCGCGKQVKLRTPPNGGVTYYQIPHHNKPKRKAT